MTAVLRFWLTHQGELATLVAEPILLVVISTANGLKFTDFKLKYHEGALEGADPRYARRPVELPNDYDAVRKAIDKVS